jgi:uncharacterized C2H2 Zn-finger protein
MRQLKVYKLSDGQIGIRCPRCDEVVVPIENPVGLDGYDCPECDQVIESSQLRLYRKALSELEYGEEAEYQ